MFKKPIFQNTVNKHRTQDTEHRHRTQTHVKNVLPWIALAETQTLVANAGNYH